jgi:hypothetical protein
MRTITSSRKFKRFLTLFFIFLNLNNRAAASFLVFQLNNFTFPFFSYINFSSRNVKGFEQLEHKSTATL